MSQSLISEMTADETEIKVAIERIFVELEHEREQMKRDQEDIERSRSRTRAMLAQMKAA